MSQWTNIENGERAIAINPISEIVDFIQALAEVDEGDGLVVLARIDRMIAPGYGFATLRMALPGMCGHFRCGQSGVDINLN